MIAERRTLVLFFSFVGSTAHDRSQCQKRCYTMNHKLFTCGCEGKPKVSHPQAFL